MVKDHWANCFTASSPKYYFSRHNGKSTVELQKWLEGMDKITTYHYGKDETNMDMLRNVFMKYSLTAEQAKDDMRIFAAHIDEFYIDTGVNPHIDIEGLLNLLEEETE